MIYENKRALLRAQVGTGDVVLDVGFMGQGIREDDPNWPHGVLKKITPHVYGVDLELPAGYRGNSSYAEGSAEAFEFDMSFDVVFAGDLIEHLSNPGLFLERVLAQLRSGGKLILTTPNAFNLFNIAEKLTKREPTVNPDHTFYFNSKTLLKLLEKNGLRAREVSFLYTLGYAHRESWKKKALNVLYWFLACFTDKFVETLVVVAEAA